MTNPAILKQFFLDQARLMFFLSSKDSHHTCHELLDQEVLSPSILLSKEEDYFQGVLYSLQRSEGVDRKEPAVNSDGYSLDSNLILMHR
jgi:hypothetical protein